MTVVESLVLCFVFAVFIIAVALRSLCKNWVSLV